MGPELVVHLLRSPELKISCEIGWKEGISYLNKQLKKHHQLHLKTQCYCYGYGCYCYCLHFSCCFLFHLVYCMPHQFRSSSLWIWSQRAITEEEDGVSLHFLSLGQVWKYDFVIRIQHITFHSLFLRNFWVTASCRLVGLFQLCLFLVEINMNYNYDMI